MSSKRIYNRVMQATDICPLGELLTDKELERLKSSQPRRNWPFTMKVKVKSLDIRFSFGIRILIVNDYELLTGEYSTEYLEKLLNSPLAKALDSKDYQDIEQELENRKAPEIEFQAGDCIQWHGYDGLIIDIDGDDITIEVCGEEIYTDIEELTEQQL